MAFGAGMCALGFGFTFRVASAWEVDLVPFGACRGCTLSSSSLSSSSNESSFRPAFLFFFLTLLSSASLPSVAGVPGLYFASQRCISLRLRKTYPLLPSTSRLRFRKSSRCTKPTVWALNRSSAAETDPWKLRGVEAPERDIFARRHNLLATRFSRSKVNVISKDAATYDASLISSCPSHWFTARKGKQRAA